MSPRIPLALQSVFLRSQAGQEVHDAPKEAVKTFNSRKSFTGRILAKVSLPKCFCPLWRASRPQGAANETAVKSWLRKSYTDRGAVFSDDESIGTVETYITTESPVTDAPDSPEPNALDLPLLQEEEAVVFQEKVLSPQEYMDDILLDRGYSAAAFVSTEGGYTCKPTPLQQASYGMLVLRAVRESNTELLKSLLQAGISPNPCNVHGESLIHMACRRGDHAILRVFLEAGCSIQVTDDYGRTPLHDACWCARPAFEVVELLISRDPRLFYIKDSRGSFPLDYVKSEAEWGAWKDFFDCKKDTWFPPRDLETEGPEPAPPLTCHAPFSRQLEDPEGALPVEMAAAVADGKLSPLDALMMMEEDSESDYSDDDMSDSSYDSDYDSEDDYGSDDSYD